MSASRRLALAEIATVMIDAREHARRAVAKIREERAIRLAENREIVPEPEEPVSPALARLYELWGQPKEEKGRQARAMVREKQF